MTDVSPIKKEMNFKVKAPNPGLLIQMHSQVKIERSLSVMWLGPPNVFKHTLTYAYVHISDTL